MCEQYKYRQVTVDFERDNSIRATEVTIVNHDAKGDEWNGLKVICYDNGRIEGGVALCEGVDIVGHAEMRG